MTRPGPRAYATLALLSALNFLNFTDRFVVGGIQELIKGDAGFPGGARDAAGKLTDASLGALTTLFVVVFMLASPVTGWLGDRLPRRYLIAAGVTVWSLATFGSGLAPSFGYLLLARAFIGAGEAGYATVAPSLIADHFPPAWRGATMGLFNLVVPLGAACGFAVGATLGTHYGWRTSFFAAGLPGFALAVAALFLDEPVRGNQDTPGAAPAAPLPLRETLAALRANRTYVIQTVGQVLLNFTVGGLANWMPSFLVRELSQTQAQAGQYFGVLTASAGILGTVAGTLAGEAAVRRHPQGYLLVSGAGLILAAPVIVLVSQAPGLVGTLAATFVALALVLFNNAPLYTSLLNAVPPGLRSSAVAFNLFAVHVLGDAISPPIIGLVSDATGSLALAVAANAVPVLLGGVVLVWGGLTATGPSASQPPPPAAAPRPS